MQAKIYLSQLTVIFHTTMVYWTQEVLDLPGTVVYVAEADRIGAEVYHAGLLVSSLISFLLEVPDIRLEYAKYQFQVSH